MAPQPRPAPPRWSGRPRPAGHNFAVAQRAPADTGARTHNGPEPLPGHPAQTGGPAETGVIRPHGISQDKGIASIILSTRDTMAVTEPIQLFGIQRKDVQPSLNQPFHNGAPWDFDSD